MAQSGYGLTLSGASVGSITGVKNINVGGIELDFDEIATVGDTNRITEHIPLKCRELPMDITLKMESTVYATLRSAVKAQTSDTFTLTDSMGSTDIGVAFVARVGGKNYDTDGHSQFSISLQPKTSFVFTA